MEVTEIHESFVWVIPYILTTMDIRRGEIQTSPFLVKTILRGSQHTEKKNAKLSP
jgi:hypothetical protein